MGNQILKNLKMSSYVTDWHHVAAGRGSVWNWLMKGLDIFHNSVIWGDLSYLKWVGKLHALPPLFIPSSFIYESLSSKCSLKIFWIIMNTALCIMKEFVLFLLNLDRLRKELQPDYKSVLREKSFPFLFTHFSLDLSIMLDDSQ